jgi:hypothetical protein
VSAQPHPLGIVRNAAQLGGKVGFFNVKPLRVSAIRWRKPAHSLGEVEKPAHDTGLLRPVQ